MQTASLPPNESDDLRRPARNVTAWRQPVVWLGLLIFLASLAGCLTMIVLASRHEDPLIDTDVGNLMKVPLSRHPADAATSARPPPVQ